MNTDATDGTDGEAGVIPLDAAGAMPAELAGLTPEQQLAATCLDRDVLVTAGAGSGKTKTLVARYLWLVGHGLSPRRILAITFTDKAALEMRSRVREAVARQVGAGGVAQGGEGRQSWAEAEAEIEAARIGTIHSLCAEILRAHPAEAVVDPGFEVADEARARLLKAQAVEDALAWAPSDGEVAQLPDRFGLLTLRRLLAYLLDRRLEAREAMEGGGVEGGDGRAAAAVAAALRAAVSEGPLAEGIAGLRDLRAAGGLAEDAGPKLAEQIEGLLDVWGHMEAALAGGDVVTAAERLFAARREHMRRGAGKRDSEAKAYLDDVQAAYDALVDPWLGGKEKSDPPPDPQAEALFEADRARLGMLFHRAESGYREALSARRALDFDDLEFGAMRLLDRPEIRARWQAAFGAILVDEFQDTNARQIAIVTALRGDAEGHRLFIVGDARQSIYRFRGADVTAFERMERSNKARGALTVRLNRSFRSHGGLINSLDAVLSACIQPYTPLDAHREEARAGVRSPFIELVVGAGADTESARPIAARALADRLVALRASGEIGEWQDVALLFRASSGYTAYEAAFEERGIPFVTVAGGGFYDRPEIRDILGILRALAEPWNDLALAGLLRSPAFGLTDAALAQLRWDTARGKGRTMPRRLRAALADRAVLDGLGEVDRARARRADGLIAELAPLVDRLSVAEVLKAVVDRLDYRAVLATGGSRLWRNLDKLLADARASRMVRVRAFLDYVQALKDVGAREGEAASEGAGAVQLMTIHKAKGLEFPFTVIADAAHAHAAGGAVIYLDRDIGPAFSPDRLAHPPLAWRLAKDRDRAASEAESGRLLYVAATRACEKLLINGHVTGDGQRDWSARGWLKALLDASGANLGSACAPSRELRVFVLPGGGEVGVQMVVDDPARPEAGAPAGPAWTTGSAALWPETGETALYEAPPPKPAMSSATASTVDSDEHVDEAGVPADAGENTEPVPRLGRVTRVRHAPGEVVGSLVHRAIERWCFPGDPRLDRLLEAEANRLGLVEPAQRDEALARARELLERLHGHPLWTEIDTADERRHELPYVLPPSQPGRAHATRRLDLLYRRDNGWAVVDFKTDEVADEGSLEPLLKGSPGKPGYRAQVLRYAAAVQKLAGIAPVARLCFLDYRGGLRVEDVSARGEDVGSWGEDHGPWVEGAGPWVEDLGLWVEDAGFSWQ